MVTESLRRVLFAMQNRTLGPHLVAELDTLSPICYGAHTHHCSCAPQLPVGLSCMLGFRVFPPIRRCSQGLDPAAAWSVCLTVRRTFCHVVRKLQHRRLEGSDNPVHLLRGRLHQLPVPATESKAMLTMLPPHPTWPIQHVFEYPLFTKVSRRTLPVF
jgi:hypothetical protein